MVNLTILILLILVGVLAYALCYVDWGRRKERDEARAKAELYWGYLQSWMPHSCKLIGAPNWEKKDG